MDLGAFQPAIAMILHVESEFAVQNAGFLRPDPEKHRIFPEHFRKNSGIVPEKFVSVYTKRAACMWYSVFSPAFFGAVAVRGIQRPPRCLRNP